MTVEFDTFASGYSIRLATPGDAKALRMLLPGMGSAAVSFVAVDGRHQLVIGAAAATREHRRSPLVGPGIAVHVIPPCRRQGIGRQLLAYIEAIATDAGAAAVYGAKRVDLDGEEMQGWRWLGFETCETVEHHRLILAPLETRLGPLIDRIIGRGRIPADARVIPLYKADLQAVLRLHLENLGGDRDDLHRRLSGQGPDAFLPQDSRVLVVGDQVKGCIVGHRKDAETFVVDANIVDRSLRGGWANVWLKLETCRCALRSGATNIEFTTFDRYIDTRRFTKELGAVTTGTSALMFRPVQRIAEGAAAGG